MPDALHTPGKKIVGGRSRLDDVLDDIGVVGSTSTEARPGVVPSLEGTALEAKPVNKVSPYINQDCGAPLSPDVDSLFGATKSYQKYKKEKFEHRLMLWYKLNGYSNKEIAQLTGYHEVTIGQVSRQPWFQDAFCKLAEEMGKNRIESFLEGQVLPALERTVTLATSGESEAVRLAANREILDRFLGKATVKVESKSTVDVTATTVNAAELMREQARLDEQLRARGIVTHGNS